MNDRNHHPHQHQKGLRTILLSQYTINLLLTWKAEPRIIFKLLVALSKTQITLFSKLQRINTKYGISVVIKRMSLPLSPKNLLFRIYHLLMTHPQNARDLLCKEKAEAFWLEAAALVLDHAIYSKALEILLKEGNEALKTFMNLGMGGFHACFLFFAVIWKHFGDAGLKDLIIESVLHLGDGTVEQIMKGSNITIQLESIMSYLKQSHERK